MTTASYSLDLLDSGMVLPPSLSFKAPNAAPAAFIRESTSTWSVRVLCSIEPRYRKLSSKCITPFPTWKSDVSATSPFMIDAGKWWPLFSSFSWSIQPDIATRTSRRSRIWYWSQRPSTLLLRVTVYVSVIHSVCFRDCGCRCYGSLLLSLLWFVVVVVVMVRCCWEYRCCVRCRVHCRVCLYIPSCRVSAGWRRRWRIVVCIVVCVCTYLPVVCLLVGGGGDESILNSFDTLSQRRNRTPTSPHSFDTLSQRRNRTPTSPRYVSHILMRANRWWSNQCRLKIAFRQTG